MKDYPQISQIDADYKKQDNETFAIIGSAMNVHKEFGHGFLEAVYQEALEYEFKLNNIPFEKEKYLQVYYKGSVLKCHYQADFVCFDSVIVELKAIQQLTNANEAQVINYLKASGLNRALLINFGASSLQYKRLVFNLQEK